MYHYYVFCHVLTFTCTVHFTQKFNKRTAEYLQDLLPPTNGTLSDYNQRDTTNFAKPKQELIPSKSISSMKADIWGTLSKLRTSNSGH